MDDLAILDLLWQHAETAIHFVSVKFGRRLMAIALNILHNKEDAEESVNDTYLALWNEIPPNYPEAFAGYVYRTGRNIAVDKWRYNTAEKRNSKYDVALDELLDVIPSSTLEETMDAHLLGETINRFLGSIKEENRIIFLKRYWFGDNISEISIQMGLRKNTVSVRLNRLRKDLKNYLEKEGFQNEV